MATVPGRASGPATGLERPVRTWPGAPGALEIDQPDLPKVDSEAAPKRGSALVIGEGIEVKGEMAPGFEEILSPEALHFVASLERRFGEVRRRLLAARRTFQTRIDSEARLPTKAPINEGTPIRTTTRNAMRSDRQCSQPLVIAVTTLTARFTPAAIGTLMPNAISNGSRTTPSAMPTMPDT